MSYLKFRPFISCFVSARSGHGAEPPPPTGTKSRRPAGRANPLAARSAQRERKKFRSLRTKKDAGGAASAASPGAARDARSPVLGAANAVDRARAVVPPGRRTRGGGGGVATRGRWRAQAREAARTGGRRWCGAGDGEFLSLLFCSLQGGGTWKG